MIWLAATLLASLAGLWFAWSRGLKLPALVLVAVAFSLVFLLGRRIEGARDVEWQELARRVQGTFQRDPGAGLLARFGAPAPWTAWAADGELQCPRAIVAADAHEPFALLQVRYSVRQRRGEEQPDAWYEVSVAAVRIPGGRATGSLAQVPAGADHVAAHNGEWLFLWKRGPLGAGEPPRPGELADLLQRAAAALKLLSPAAPPAPPAPPAAPAGPAPASPRTPP
jgi:hypothetical protein